jgi:YidC/Oxa1 family membrane protein insertase
VDHAADVQRDVLLLPSGLVLYWLTNNILSIAQQWIINKRMGVPPQFNLPKFGKAAEGK